MPSFWRPFSSRKNPPLKDKSKSSNDISGTDDRNRKLTRQRKLRYATDDELGLKSSSKIREESQSLPVSPVYLGSGSQTPHRAGPCWSKYAVPQPLPLPEVNSYLAKQDESCRDLHSSRYPSQQFLAKTKTNLVERSPITSTSNYRSRGLPQEIDVDCAKNIFRYNVPTRSAPSSYCPSPAQSPSPEKSPQRYNTSDLFHGLRGDNGCAKTCGRVSVYSQTKSFAESRQDSNNAIVHPLPLPPSCSRPSPSARQGIDKSDISWVKGQWRKGKLIGRGTYGSVYIATHCETGAICAVKEVEMIPDDPKCAECIKQLEQEMKFLEEFKHPNIVEYYGCEVIEDRFCIYLEYVHPGSVIKYVQEHRGAMTESIVRNFTRHIVSGLAYLHSKKTIHRDIKGANLLVNASGIVKLADFGLAKHLAANDIDLSLKGTPHWISPEVLQAALRKDATPELAYGVDIWSVGCTVIEMLTGQPPWSEYTGVQAMFNIIKKDPPIPEDLSEEGKDFLRWCFQRRPEDRPSSSKLLNHPFLRSSNDQNGIGFAYESPGTKLQNMQSWSPQNMNVMPFSSAATTPDRKMSMKHENRISSTESLDRGKASPRHSPWTLVEDLHCSSSPELVQYSNIISPSHYRNNFSPRAANSKIYTFACKGVSLI